jgi:hypothetical protein
MDTRNDDNLVSLGEDTWHITDVLGEIVDRDISLLPASDVLRPPPMKSPQTEIIYSDVAIILPLGSEGARDVARICTKIGRDAETRRLIGVAVKDDTDHGQTYFSMQ